MNTAMSGLEIELNAYPHCTNGIRLPVWSDSLPKYPLLNPAVASAIPSSIPMSTIEKPMLFRYIGITGYSISLAVSVNRLTSDSIHTVFVIAFIAPLCTGIKVAKFVSRTIP